jgi:hypothetical protein
MKASQSRHGQCLGLALTPTTKEAMMMIEAKQSYRERIRAERAAASAQRKVEREARYRQSEVICEDWR